MLCDITKLTILFVLEAVGLLATFTYLPTCNYNYFFGYRYLLIMAAGKKQEADQ